MFGEAVHILGERPGDCVMVGDDLENDVLGAVKYGITGILVKTGKYKPTDKYEPWYTEENFASFIDNWFEKKL